MFVLSYGSHLVCDVTYANSKLFFSTLLKTSAQLSLAHLNHCATSAGLKVAQAWPHAFSGTAVPSLAVPVPSLAVPDV